MNKKKQLKLDELQKEFEKLDRTSSRHDPRVLTHAFSLARDGKVEEAADAIMFVYDELPKEKIVAILSEPPGEELAALLSDANKAINNSKLKHDKEFERLKKEVADVQKPLIAKILASIKKFVTDRRVLAIVGVLVITALAVIAYRKYKQGKGDSITKATESLLEVSPLLTKATSKKTIGTLTIVLGILSLVLATLRLVKLVNSDKDITAEGGVQIVISYLAGIITLLKGISMRTAS